MEYHIRTRQVSRAVAIANDKKVRIEVGYILGEVDDG